MEILTRYRDPLVQAMDSLLGGPPSPILAMCRYHLGLADVDGIPTREGAGKMLRPALCLAMCEALRGDIHQCLPAALSLELTHRTSLIFDDIQDRSPQRNHRPTVWGVWGVDQAINAGLALSCYARLALHRMADEGASLGTVLQVHRLLEETVIDLCRGQYWDLRHRDERISVEQYLEMVSLKTGALLATACEVGALVAGAHDRREAARRLGESLGTAFQLQDDILGVWGEEAKLGKAPNDLDEHRTGLPLVILWGQEAAVTGPREGIVKLYELLETYGVRRQAEARAVEFSEMALAALKDLELPAFWRENIEGLVGLLAHRDA